MLRSKDKLRILNLTCIPFNHTAIIYPIPTWYDMEELCKSVFSNVTVDKLSDTVANQVLNSIHEKYNPDVYIFTDESRIESPEISCSAGVVVNQDNTKMMNYRLPPENSIMGCELYAIEQALIHVSDLLSGQEIKSVVIYSDFLSSIQAIRNLCPSSYKSQILLIHELIHTLNQQT